MNNFRSALIRNNKSLLPEVFLVYSHCTLS